MRLNPRRQVDSHIGRAHLLDGAHLQIFRHRVEKVGPAVVELEDVELARRRRVGRARVAAKAEVAVLQPQQVLIQPALVARNRVLTPEGRDCVAREDAPLRRRHGEAVETRVEEEARPVRQPHAEVLHSATKRLVDASAMPTCRCPPLDVRLGEQPRDGRGHEDAAAAGEPAPEQRERSVGLRSVAALAPLQECVARREGDPAVVDVAAARMERRDQARRPDRMLGSLSGFG
eukprot:6843664-Prymnesium_polylepis.1